MMGSQGSRGGLGKLIRAVFSEHVREKIACHCEISNLVSQLPPFLKGERGDYLR